MKSFSLRAFLGSFLLLAACGGGGGGGSSAPADGGLQVTLDTTAGLDATVQVQLVGAVLTGPAGTTGNLLRAPRQLTVADPSGAPDGFELANVPAGAWTGMRLGVAPGSASALLADGSVAAVDLPSIEVAVPFETEVVHATSRGWVALRHAAALQLAGTGARRSCTLDLLGGPAAATPIGPASAAVTLAQGTTVFGTLGDDDLRVQLELEVESELFDDNGGRVGREDFARGLGSGSEIDFTGFVGADDRVRVRRGRRLPAGDGPRLLGRIVTTDPATTSFVLDVQALVRRGDVTPLAVPERVTVLAAGARIHDSSSFTAIPFASLGAGDLVKVTVLSRAGATVRAREIDVESRAGMPARPEIEGAVAAVDPATGVVTVVPRRDDPLVVGGVAVQRAEIRVQPHTVLLRVADSGGGRTTIPLTGIVPGADRIWIRGSAVAPATVAADWIRVRDDR